MLFTDFALADFLYKNIDKLGWNTPTDIQSIGIPKILDGFDILGCAPTGTGKSAAFLLPIISLLSKEKLKDNEVRVLILEPTRELAAQLDHVANLLLENSDITASSIIGGAGREEQRESISNITVATPGRLKEFIKKDWIDLSKVKYLVIDEADRMLDMGFRDVVLKIAKKCKRREQSILFSATLEGYGIKEFSSNLLDNAVEIKVGSGDNDEKLPELLSQRAYYAANDMQKDKILLHLLTTSVSRGIIFARTKANVDDLARLLSKNKIQCATIKGENAQSERNAAIRRFKDKEVNILVATDVASRGLDVEGITHVYNYDLPSSAAVYVHRAGRTARANQSGIVVNIVSNLQLSLLEKIERYTQSDIERRSIKGLCASFPLKEEQKGGINRTGRATIGGKGGFDKKDKNTSSKPRDKKRWRVTKNKGKPDFAKKRAKKALTKGVEQK